MWVTEVWHTLLRGCGVFSLEIFKSHLSVVLGSLPWVSLLDLVLGAFTGGPFQPQLWCDSMIILWSLMGHISVSGLQPWTVPSILWTGPKLSFFHSSTYYLFLQTKKERNKTIAGTYKTWNWEDRNRHKSSWCATLEVKIFLCEFSKSVINRFRGYICGEI